MAELIIKGIRTKDGVAKIDYDAIHNAPNITKQIVSEEIAAAISDKLTYGTEDMTAGKSELKSGTFYFVYEE